MSENKFYDQSAKDVIKLLSSDKDQGLTAAAAADLLAKYGHNALNEAKRTTLLQKFINQFKDFMIAILAVAAVVAALTGEVVDAIFILLVVVLNAIFGVFQESKAEDAIEALKQMSTPNANVLRDGKVLSVPATDLVVGDIVLLEAGDIIPADLRLIDVSSLKIEEAALTGESVAVEKSAGVLRAKNPGLGDRHNMAFMNTNATYGRATGIVVATGMQTEVGHIANMLEQTEETATPLQMNLKQLGKTLTYLILVISLIVFVIGMLKGAENFINMLLTAISIAVAAIPEGLPAIVTITLALGTGRLAKKNALMRRLAAVETLGSTQIIGSDKTGTLTQNKMTVEKYVVDNQVYDAERSIEGDATAERLAVVMALNNDTKRTEEGLIGDPTETALITFNEKQNQDLDSLFDRMGRVAEIPFDSERKLMTTVNNHHGKYLITVKGAPDELLRRTSQIEIKGKIQPLTEENRQQLLEINHELAQQALRVLAFAFQNSDEVPGKMTSKLVEQNLVFAGFVAMIDPERPEVAQAVKEARQAGIRPIMITGDHRDTAAAIAIRLGILTKEQGPQAVITGAELDKISDEDFNDRVTQYSVYARVAPEHKVRIVHAWQKRDKIVAMTGDGVNDAPALKTADIGVAMGITGTEVSKGASDMVLADDNFATIVNAVKEGRTVFANIQKALQYLLSSNLAEVMTLFVMTIMGWNLFVPVMILWINLVTDTFPAIALGLEPTEPGIMQRPPRGKSSSFLSDGVGPAIVWQGIIQSLTVLSVYALAVAFPDHPGSQMLIHRDALTMSFMTLGLMQLVNAFNVKSVYQSILRVGPFKNKYFNGAILISLLSMAIVVLVPGLNGIFHVSDLNLHQWSIVLAASFSIIVVVEIVKLCQRKFFKKI
ncbi:cation-translocating P-type ATPase [Oenococcus kitaharae]|uniref:P-type Ca(2+) transporter n=1 Tax=Oenococcus kitaharae DSM 17330 TaxID=1045004 RepID=G9WI78_9LACO|nr:HAD-IC family P-type ATPase [Oenococcus kitaharae]EHN59200.1 Calcium-transporting ATPase [Oenococcus kitaharae DSM 17330]OEY82265.1 ATPase [Oenococcus kitaharae]OEY82688.1 ATPase [Oenococcus kitaharae]OEY84945.1 ATPase [Oenococcus kitaharae]